MDNINIIQWNCQGVRSKKDKLLDLVENYKPDVLALQETKLWKDCKFELTGHSCVRKDGHYNRTPHGGVEMYIHQSVPVRLIPLRTELQAIVAQINIWQTATICNIYISDSHNFSIELLQEVVDQLPEPYIIMGDFNGHNMLWGSANTYMRGRVIEELANNNNCHILNDCSMTRVAYSVESAMDISICSSALTPIKSWHALSSPGNSDHCPNNAIHFILFNSLFIHEFCAGNSLAQFRNALTIY